jgi:hypothetical protein
MTTGFVIQLDNGHNGWCVESLRGVTYCGVTFDPDDVEREPYRHGPSCHDMLCFDCSKADSRRVRGAADEVVG